MAAGTRLGVDFGTSNTVAVLARPDGRVNPLLVDGQPQLPSAVCATPAEELLVGRAALHSARLHPEGYEPNPKRRIDDGVVLLGGGEYEVVALFAAVLRRVADETRRVTGEASPAEIRLTHPAVWGGARRDLLRRSAVAAGWPAERVGLVPEPVAAAAAFAEVHGARLPVGGNALVYDLGGGTFDATVLRRTASGFDVRATDGLVDAGGLDIDHSILEYVGTIVQRRDPDAWRALTAPATAAERRARWLFQDDVRSAKELLSNTASTLIPVPLIDDELPLTRTELDNLTRPLLERTITSVQGVLRGAGITPGDLSAVFLVGGSTRIPLVATLLHRTLGVPATVLEQPELIVAEGALRVRAFDAPPAAPAPRSAPPAPTPYGAPRYGLPPHGVAQHGAAQHGAAQHGAAQHGAAQHGAAGQQQVAAQYPGPPFPPRPAHHPGGWRPGQATRPYPLAPEPQAAPGPARGERDVRGAESAPAPYSPTGPNAAPAAQAGAARPNAAPVSAAPVSAAPVSAAPVSAAPVSAAPVSAAPVSAAPVSAAPARGSAPVSALPFSVAPVSAAPVSATPVSATPVSAAPVSAAPVSAVPVSAPSVVRTNPTTQIRTMHQPGDSVALHGHDGAVSGLVVSPDSTRLATAGADGTVRIWDLATGRRIVTLTGHAGRVNGLAASPDGSRLVSVADDKTVRVWDPAAGSQLAELTGHTDMVRAVAFHRDGVRVATGGFDHTVRIWDTRAGRNVGTLTGHGDVVRSVAFHPDGRRIATGSFDQSVRIWDVGSGQQIASLTGHGLVHSVAFSPDGRVLATAGVDGTARLWETDTGRPLGERLAGHSGAVTAVAFRPDGRAVATAGIDGTARLWNVLTGRALTAPIGGHTAALTAVAFTPDSRFLVTAGHDATARVHPL